MTTKYRAKRTVVDGHTFASKAEAAYYKKLRALAAAGKIGALELQPRFELQGAFTDRDGVKHRKIEYVADFSYFDIASGQWHVVDVKGMRTEVFKLKKKLLLYKQRDFVFEEV